MELIIRKNDIIFGTSDLEVLHSIEKFPIFMGCTEEPPETDKFAEQTWVICPRNGTIQLEKLIPLEILYKTQHAGSVGSTWLNHHESFSKFISKYQPRKVLEIGGAHGILAKKTMGKGNLNWTILEPNPIPVEGCNAKFIRGFFDENFKFGNEIDTIIHSHVLEHIYEPNKFMQNIASYLREKQKLIFSIPNMNIMLRKKYTNCINFEHTYFIDEGLADYLVTKNGFKIIDKEYFKDDHSIFYCCEKRELTEVINMKEENYIKNKNIFNDYIDYHNKLVKDINDQLEDKDHKDVFLFGAHIFSQYLLMFGLNTKKIQSILDNDNNKQGKRLYGTDFKVRSPKILKNIKKPVVILKAGAYDNEIMKDILENINPNTKFIT